MKLKFELTNEQRKYLGLIPVEEDWELVKEVTKSTKKTKSEEESDEE